MHKKALESTGCIGKDTFWIIYVIVCLCNQHLLLLLSFGLYYPCWKLVSVEPLHQWVSPNQLQKMITSQKAMCLCLRRVSHLQQKEKKITLCQCLPLEVWRQGRIKRAVQVFSCSKEQVRSMSFIKVRMRCNSDFWLCFHLNPICRCI